MPLSQNRRDSCLRAAAAERWRHGDALAAGAAAALHVLKVGGMARSWGALRFLPKNQCDGVGLQAEAPDGVWSRAFGSEQVGGHC